MSYRCLNENYYDRDKCEVYFVNYNNCKEFWVKLVKNTVFFISYCSLFQNNVQLTRRRQGVSPTLPPVEERLKIKEEYMKTKPFI